MRIGIIGVGGVGGTLGRVLAQRGHEVVFGVGDVPTPELGLLLGEAGISASAGTVAEAASFGEVVVLTTPWDAVQEALEEAGDLAGKILLDCTNPLLPDLSDLEIGHTTSGAEQVAAWAPGAVVVKVFNTVGFNAMANPFFGEERATMFLCGDDPVAKEAAARLAASLGFEPVDAGPLVRARLLEPLALLWLRLAADQGPGKEIAFRLLRR
jgi:8-hydroxy-5-deazaflavin:NADPH oxidoreductase